MDRREFLASLSAAAFAGCSTGAARRRAPARLATSEFHVFSKMFQPPVVETPEKLCELMKGAGYDGIQWTVRKGGHVEPADAAANLYL